MKKRGRVDTHQATIVELWRREFNFSVAITSALGDGFGDVVIGVPGPDPRNEIVEIKTDNAPLTSDEKEFHRDWKGPPVWIIRSIAQARSWAQDQIANQESRRIDLTLTHVTGE